MINVLQNQLYNTGVSKLENAFEELLSRNTRPLSPTTLMDMIALEEGRFFTIILVIII